MDIYLVRHGEAAASWAQAPDPGLSVLGLEQAIAASRTLLPQLTIADVQLISSPLARARETAAPLAAELGLAVQVNDAFREIQAPVPLEQRQAWLRQFMRQRWDEQPASLHLWREQATVQLLALRASTVIFTHFLVINAVVGQLQDCQDTVCCWPDNACITHLRRTDNGLELVALGQQMATLVT